MGPTDVRVNTRRLRECRSPPRPKRRRTVRHRWPSTSTAASRAIPRGEPLTYAWDLDGDAGSTTRSLCSRPTPTCSRAPTLRGCASSTRKDKSATSAPITISADNTPPTPTIGAPAAGTTWKVGDVISFSGSATDAQQETLPASSLSWELVQQHCPADCHSHPVRTWTGVASGSFNAPDHEYPSYLKLRLSATDAGGLTATETLRLDPRTVELSFQSSPSGLQLTHRQLEHGSDEDRCTERLERDLDPMRRQLGPRGRSERCRDGTLLSRVSFVSAAPDARTTTRHAPCAAISPHWRRVRRRHSRSRPRSPGKAADGSPTPRTSRARRLTPLHVTTPPALAYGAHTLPPSGVELRTPTGDPRAYALLKARTVARARSSANA
jgi:hypothetical protein